MTLWADRRTEFGGWPWPAGEVGPTFGTRGRFAELNGAEELPPSLAAKRVKLVGLQKEALNGRVGLRGAFDMAKGRFAVTLDGEVDVMAVKELNLEDE